MAINCASLPEGLIESELFGYVGGSFTGANKNGNAGKLELSHGGTLFLDEIGDMPLKLQPLLLRVLEDKRIMRIGDNKYTQTDFRVIAATNKDLYALIKQHKFREDLYYRLTTLEITIPPLRSRGMDIIELAHYFLEKYSLKMDTKKPFLEDNVKQLQNAMYYALNICENDKISINDLPKTIIDHKRTKDLPRKPQSLRELESEAITAALAYTDHNIFNAAEILGISKTTLYRKLKSYNMNEES